MKADYKYTGEKPDHISYSQIQTGRCLYKYMQQKLKNKFPVGNDAIKKGKFVHEVIYRYTDYCVKEHTEADYEKLNEIFESLFNKSGLPDSTYMEMRDIIYTFGEKEIEAEKINDYEKRETIEFEKGKKIVVILDRTNAYRNERGSCMDILDFKNSMVLPTKADVEKNLQLRIYRYAGINFLYPGFEEYRAGIHNTRYNFIRWTDYYKPFDLSIDFDNIKSYLSRQFDRLLKTDEYPPERCAACTEYGGCEIMNAGLCPLWTESEVEKLKKEMDVKSRVQLYRYLKMQADNIRKELQIEFKVKEPENIDGGMVGYQGKKSFSYDLQKFVNYCEAGGLNLSGELSKTAAEKIIGKAKIKKLSGVEKEFFDEMKIKKCSTVFKI